MSRERVAGVVRAFALLLAVLGVAVLFAGVYGACAWDFAQRHPPARLLAVFPLIIGGGLIQWSFKLSAMAAADRERS